MKKVLTLAALAAVILVGCGPKDPASNWKNMTLEEIDKLPEAKQQEIQSKMTPADSTALTLGATKYIVANDTVALKKKTMGEIIKEGEAEQAKAK